MQSLHGHGEANGMPLTLCALERESAEQKTRENGCKMRPIVQRSGARSRDLVCREWHRQEARRALFLKRVSQSIPH